jgi:hypothetical protein
MPKPVPASPPLSTHPHSPLCQQPAHALAVTLDRHRPALPSTRNRPRTAVRQGASWTAAYHLQLTVAAVARPVPSSVGAPGVLAAERSWLLLAQTTSARPSVQPLSSGRASSRGRPCQQASHGVGRRCPHAVSTHPGSASGIRLSSRPVSGHLGSSSRGSGSRPSAVHPSSVQPSAVQSPALGRLVSAPVRPDASFSSHSGGGVGDPGRGGRDAGDAAKVALVGGRSVADPGRRGGCGPQRPRLTTRATRQARPAYGAPLVGSCAVGTGAGCARGGGTRHMAGVLGWGRDHGGWSSPSLTPGWGGPGGATGCAGGDGRAAPARPKPAASAPGSLPAAL